MLIILGNKILVLCILYKDCCYVICEIILLVCYMLNNVVEFIII